MKKISDDIAHALDKCAESLSINELSRITGVRIELLRRFISRKTLHIRAETWDKIYPVLQPYLTGPEPAKEKMPVRVGRPYRRHHDLVEMNSDQKVLLDAFDMLQESDQKKLVHNLIGRIGSDAPSSFSALSALENQLMGAYLRLPAEEQNQMLLQTLDAATAEARRRRTELF